MITFAYIIPYNPQSLRFLEFPKDLNFKDFYYLLPFDTVFNFNETKKGFKLSTNLSDGQEFSYHQEGLFPRNQEEKHYIAYRMLLALGRYKYKKSS